LPTIESTEERIEVTIDADLRDLMPQYIANRHRDVALLQQALTTEDYARIRIIGHGMKGSGGGYGLYRISEFGALIESAALDSNGVEIAQQAVALEDYLKRLKLTFA
jgi:HPt (histidine-containing phosphotransfer) domain-containing protein